MLSAKRIYESSLRKRKLRYFLHEIQQNKISTLEFAIGILFVNLEETVAANDLIVCLDDELLRYDPLTFFSESHPWHREFALREKTASRLLKRTGPLCWSTGMRTFLLWF